MPESMLPLADIRIKVLGGVVLPAHASALVLNCGALARSSELFADATSKAPVVLSSPFDKYKEAAVVRFLACLYTGANASVRGEDAAEPAVLRLAHALDATQVLDAARRQLLEQELEHATLEKISEINELAHLRLGRCLCCGRINPSRGHAARYFCHHHGSRSVFLPPPWGSRSPTPRPSVLRAT
jgi:hypothetical protein